MTHRGEPKARLPIVAGEESATITGWVAEKVVDEGHAVLVSTGRPIMRPFEDARKCFHTLGLKNQHEWRLYISGQLPSKPARPRDIRSAPAQLYKSIGWVSWGDCLGTPTIASQNGCSGHSSVLGDLFV